MKACTTCREFKPTAAYSVLRHAADGLQSQCKACRAAHSRAVYAANRDRELARASHGREARREQRRAYNKAWRLANLDRDRESKRIREAARRTRIRGGLVIKFTPSQLTARLSMFAGCWICGGLADQADHVKPIAAGGGHLLANLRPICGDCNRRKRSKWPVDRDALARR